MFDRTLASSWDERSRRGLSTLTSLMLQLLVTALLVAVPLLKPQSLLSSHQISTPISLGEPPAATPPPRSRIGASGAIAENVATIVLTAPRQIPSGIPLEGGEISATLSTGPAPAGIGQGLPGALPNWFGTRPIMPVVHPPTAASPVRISHMREGDLLHEVQPAYPALARSARIQGTVVLQAVISKEGFIKDLKLVSGHPMLAGAAIDAVKQWHYRPYVLNGEPVEVETQITLNFSLAN